jgi:hypothetical protein
MEQGGARTQIQVCRNRRRNFFVIGRFAMPERVYPGRHTL